MSFPKPLILLCALVGFHVCEDSLLANPLKIELVSAVESIQPGVPVQLALHLQHKENYHSYWKFPGIVGVPTSIKWQLPDGWTAGPIEWPEPKRVDMFEIQAHGYHGEKFLPILLTPPKDLPAGQKITLKGQATWMCCYRDCNPGAKELSITLPVKNETPEANKKWAQPIELTKLSLPKPLKEWETTATRQRNVITLTIRPTTRATREQAAQLESILFFTDDGLINSDGEQVLKKKEDGSFSLSLEVSEYAPKPMPRKLTGILQTPQAWQVGGVRSALISTPIL